jgi:hypothetical protein
MRVGGWFSAHDFGHAGITYQEFSENYDSPLVWWGWVSYWFGLAALLGYSLISYLYSHSLFHETDCNSSILTASKPILIELITY